MLAINKLIRIIINNTTIIIIVLNKIRIRKNIINEKRFNINIIIVIINYIIIVVRD